MFTINQNLIDNIANTINNKEEKSNKTTSLSSESTDTEYPSAKAVYDNISSTSNSISSAITAVNNRITNLNESNINIVATPYTQLGGATATSLAALLHNIDNNFEDTLFCAYSVSGTANAFTISGTGGLGNLTSNHSFILLAYNNIADSNAGATLTINNTMNPVTIVNSRMGGSASCAWKQGEWGIFYVNNGSAQLLGSFSDTEYYQGMEFVTSTNTQNSDISLTGVTNKLNNLKNGTIFFYQLPNLRFTSTSSTFTLTLRNNIPISGTLQENNVNQSLNQLSPNDILILQYSTSPATYNIIGKIEANTFTEKKDTALQLLCNVILPYRIFTVDTVKKESKKTTYILRYDGVPYTTNEILYIYVPEYEITAEKKPMLSWENNNMPTMYIYPINSNTALYEHDLNGYYLKIQYSNHGWVLLDKTSNIVEATTEHAGFLSASDKTKLNNLHAVATSGSYNDLTNKPTIPAKTSDLTNDSGYLTTHQTLKTINNESILGTGNINIETGSEIEIVTNWNNILSDEKVASEKLVKESLDDLRIEKTIVPTSLASTNSNFTLLDETHDINTYEITFTDEIEQEILENGLYVTIEYTENTKGLCTFVDSQLKAIANPNNPNETQPEPLNQNISFYYDGTEIGSTTSDTFTINNIISTDSSFTLYMEYDNENECFIAHYGNVEIYVANIFQGIVCWGATQTTYTLREKGVELVNSWSNNPSETKGVSEKLIKNTFDNIFYKNLAVPVNYYASIEESYLNTTYNMGAYLVNDVSVLDSIKEHGYYLEFDFDEEEDFGLVGLMFNIGQNMTFIYYENTIYSFDQEYDDSFITNMSESDISEYGFVVATGNKLKLKIEGDAYGYMLSYDNNGTYDEVPNSYVDESGGFMDSIILINSTQNLHTNTVVYPTNKDIQDVVIDELIDQTSITSSLNLTTQNSQQTVDNNTYDVYVYSVPNNIDNFQITVQCTDNEEQILALCDNFIYIVDNGDIYNANLNQSHTWFEKTGSPIMTNIQEIKYNMQVDTNGDYVYSFLGNNITSSHLSGLTVTGQNYVTATTKQSKFDIINNRFSNYVEKSTTSGLIKNDGTIDTNAYATTSFVNTSLNSLSSSLSSSFNGAISTVNNRISNLNTSNILSSVESLNNIGSYNGIVPQSTINSGINTQLGTINTKISSVESTVVNSKHIIEATRTVQSTRTNLTINLSYLTTITDPSVDFSPLYVKLPNDIASTTNGVRFIIKFNNGNSTFQTQQLYDISGSSPIRENVLSANAIIIIGWDSNKLKLLKILGKEYSTVAETGSYNDLTDKPTIPTVPTNVSAFTNDSGYLTSHQDISGKEDKTNKVTAWSSTTTNTNYPSEKLVKDSFDEIFDALSWQLVETKNNGQVNVYANDFMIALSIQDQFSFGANTSTQISTISSQYAPTYGLNGSIHHNTNPGIKFNLDTNGNITVYNQTSATNSLFRVYITYPRKSKMP